LAEPNEASAFKSTHEVRPVDDGLLGAHRLKA
jgi:hypothetical protein